MFRRLLTAAAVAAGFGLGSVAAAADDTVRLGRFQPAAGGFAGAVKSAAAAEPTDDAANDTELVRHRGGFYGGLSVR